MHLKKAFKILIIFLLTGIFAYPAELIKSNSCDSLNIEESKYFWSFDNWGNREGWTIPDILKGTVSGGALWLTIQSESRKETGISWETQVWGTNPGYKIVSPSGLSISSDQFNKIIFRIRNLSPETDGFVSWCTAEHPDSIAGVVRFTMKPDDKEWQNVICHIDNNWEGTIDRIKIQPARMWQRGDIWIDWIAITHGKIKEKIPRPDICGSDVVPKIKLPGILQEDFDDAFNVLDECLITDPIGGFNYPVMSPGGYYGGNWWQLDLSLEVAGTKWVNQKFVENVMRGFSEVQAQNPDGRIDLWSGSAIRGESGDVSSLPAYFEAGYDVATRSNDSTLQNIIYKTMKKYLSYWLSPNKRDTKTGLVTSVFEETFSNHHKAPGIIAPIDLNVAVVKGCFNTYKLAKYLGKKAESDIFFNDFRQLSKSINQFQWNEEDHVYYNYNVSENKQDKRLLCTTFNPLQLGIASPEKTKKLLTVLLNPSLFYWGIRPITSISRAEPEYMEATGDYDGTAWFGDIWTLRNVGVINGLEDAGRHDLASELTWSTIKTFNKKYCEYITPGKGSGEGVKRYGWTASQYIQLIIEHLFGINYNSFEKTIRIFPHIPADILNREIEIKDVIIPLQNELRLDLKIKKLKNGNTYILVKSEDDSIPSGIFLEVCVPDYEKKKVLIKIENESEYRPVSKINGLTNVSGIKIKMEKETKIIFN